MKILRGGYDPKRVVVIGTGKHSASKETPAAPSSVDAEPHLIGLPDRYTIREQGKQRVLSCIEAPTLTVRVERGYSMTAAAARKFPPGSIFLDGAAQGEPFIDVEKQVFNLDHHEGCVRSFTLAACEQAMIVVRKRMNLRERDWTIYASEPDLDTVFAIWILLNHIRLNDDNPEIRRAIMPLVRLQGVIDAHGLEMQEITGFPEDIQQQAFVRLEELRQPELALKKDGRWLEIDFLNYTAGLLRTIDALVYSSEHFQGAIAVEELARADIAGRWLAIACASETGIYRVEQQLRRLHGDRLGIIALQKDPKTYTLRRVDQSLPVTFERIYEQLNLRDPSAGGARSGNRWGGSDDIGGSPRSTGTGLTPQEIVEICSRSYRKPSRMQRVLAVAQSFLASAAIVPAALIATALEGIFNYRFLSLTESILAGGWLLASTFCFISFGLWLLLSRLWPQMYGFRRPSGMDWWILLLPAVAGGLAGGAPFPAPGSEPAWLLQQTLDDVLPAFVFAGAAELLFRGAVQGILLRSFRTQRPGGKWFLSWPVVISSILYVLWACFPYGALSWSQHLITCSAALVLAVACGTARERSESIVAPILLHWAALLVPVVIH